MREVVAAAVPAEPVPIGRPREAGHGRDEAAEADAPGDEVPVSDKVGEAVRVVAGRVERAEGLRRRVREVRVARGDRGLDGDGLQDLDRKGADEARAGGEGAAPVHAVPAELPRRGAADRPRRSDRGARLAAQRPELLIEAPGAAPAGVGDPEGVEVDVIAPRDARREDSPEEDSVVVPKGSGRRVPLGRRRNETRRPPRLAEAGVEADGVERPADLAPLVVADDPAVADGERLPAERHVDGRAGEGPPARPAEPALLQEDAGVGARGILLGKPARVLDAKEDVEVVPQEDVDVEARPQADEGRVGPPVGPEVEVPPPLRPEADLAADVDRLGEAGSALPGRGRVGDGQHRRNGEDAETDHPG